MTVDYIEVRRFNETRRNNANRSVSGPDGVLPPVRDVLSAGQSLYETGEIQPGTPTRSVSDVPDGSYVAPASRSRTDTDPAMWVSDYPGIEDYLAQWPGTKFTVQQVSTVVTVPSVDPTPPAADNANLDDLGTIFGS